MNRSSPVVSSISWDVDAHFLALTSIVSSCLDLAL